MNNEQLITNNAAAMADLLEAVFAFENDTTCRQETRIQQRIINYSLLIIH